jgi:hypothetical protein
MWHLFFGIVGLYLYFKIRNCGTYFLEYFQIRNYGTSEKKSELWDLFKIRNCETYFSEVWDSSPSNGKNEFPSPNISYEKMYTNKVRHEFLKIHRFSCLSLRRAQVAFVPFSQEMTTLPLYNRPKIINKIKQIHRSYCELLYHFSNL